MQIKLKSMLNHRFIKILFLTMVFLVTKPVFAQWECIYCYGGNSLPFKFEKIHFKDTMNGFGVCYIGADGFLGRTSDGGHSWDTVITQNFVIDFTFINDSIGILLGDEGISKTIDGGLTWQLKDTTITMLSNLQFPSDSIGYGTNWVHDPMNYTSIVSIFKTLDGGENWNILDSIFLNGWLGSIVFVNNDLGFISSDSVIYKSVDGGLNWIPTYLIEPYHTPHFQFINDSVGYFMGNNSKNDSLKLYKTIDAGNNWNIHSSIYSMHSFSDLIFINDTVGYLTGTWQVQKTIDGGKNWYNQYATNTQWPSFFDNTYVFSFIDENNAFLAGGFWATALFKTSNGGGILPISIPEQNTVSQIIIYPNPAKDELTITLDKYQVTENEKGVIKIFNIKGQQIYKRNFHLEDKSLVLKIGHFTSGFYLLQIELNSCIKNVKFIVQR